MFQLDMVRGKRTVSIGLFFSRQRAIHVAALLDWHPSWKPVVTEVTP